MDKMHYEMLHHSVQDAIDFVVDDQQILDGDFVDSIDNKVSSDLLEAKTVTCAACGTVNRKRKQVCVGCKDRDGIRGDNCEVTWKIAVKSYPKASFVKISFDTKDGTTQITKETTSRYSHVKHNHNGQHELIITDPVFCNSNSFETIARVLRQIGVDNGIYKYNGTKRYWTFICCDGYEICKKLKEEAVLCTVEGCNQKFFF
jgi:hypothetical protein